MFRRPIPMFTRPTSLSNQGRSGCSRWTVTRNQHELRGAADPDDPDGLPPLHAALLALHFAWYNLVRIHRTLRVTPAMAAGVTERVWELNELVH